MKFIFLFLVIATIPISQGQSRIPPGKKADIHLLASQGIGTKEGRSAWQRISKEGPELLIPLLQAMDTPDIVAANWLRTAYDRILDKALAKDKSAVDLQSLLAFARDEKRQGRARRLALNTVEILQPGTRKKLLAGWLDDSEFRYEAVEQVLERVQKLDKKSQKDEALALLSKAFASSRDVIQAQRIASEMLDMGIKQSVAKNFGFIMDWYLIGPFDAKGKKGFTLHYPPEKKVDLQETLKGQSGPVAWKYYHVEEPSPKTRAAHVALVNLREARALGDADDAVAFAYAEIEVPRAQRVEFRGSADDNFTVWVNGEKVFGFEEYYNGVRFDRHRFPVRLRAGKNTILVKIIQKPAPNLERNWEFFLRICDESGRGIPFVSTLPGRKS